MGRVHKILLVDDEPMVRRLVSLTLADATRYTLLQAADGTKALTIARRERPAVVVRDVNMPGLNGYEVCRALKAEPDTRNAVVLMLSAMGGVADRQRALEVGADAYFTKPFSPRALRRKVEEVLEREHGGS